MYETQRRMRRFKYGRPVLYAAFTTFIIMVVIAICGTLFFGPMILAGMFNCGWPMLVEFLTIPSCVGLVTHICRIYEF